MKILSNDEIKVIEQATLADGNVRPIELVERVAAEVATEVMNYAEPDDEVLVLAGWSNAGAEALCTAQSLAERGYEPVVYLFNIGGNRLNEVCVEARDRLRAIPAVKLIEVTGAEPFQWPNPSSTTTIVDGLYGTELTKPMPRSFQMMARNINESRATVISIEIPSGLLGEWNGSMPREDMMHATVTIAVEFPRLSFLLPENADVVGQWKVVRVGYDGAAISRSPFTFMLTNRNLVANNLPPRKIFSSKADYGRALIYAGSRGMGGAAVLAARGALRAGAGRVTVYSSSCNYDVVQTAAPSAMFVSDPKMTHISTMPYNPEFEGLAVGPGIGTNDETAIALERFLKASSAGGKRVVLDADALNIIAKRPNLLNYLSPLSIITPHAGEFDRIFGPSANSEERLKKALQCAEDHTLLIVLKGRYTAIVRPDGKIMFNPTGTPAMATPGSGDVLTGIIAALLAMGLQSEYAAFIGPYIHGLAGQLAAEKNGDYGVMAEDIAENVGRAIKSLHE